MGRLDGRGMKGGSEGEELNVDREVRDEAGAVLRWIGVARPEGRGNKKNEKKVSSM